MRLISILLILCSTACGQAEGDSDYWEWVNYDTTWMSGDCIYQGGYYERIPDRWTMTVDTVCGCPDGYGLTTIILADTINYHLTDTLCDSLMDHFPKNSDSTYSSLIIKRVDPTIFIDTTWTPKIPVYLDSAQHKKLMELLEPKLHDNPFIYRNVPFIYWEGSGEHWIDIHPRDTIYDLDIDIIPQTEDCDGK